MDNKGFISAEYLFSLFIILIIACGLLFYSSSGISSSFDIEDAVVHRLILDDVASEISQVNSNGDGYSKYINLPSDKGYFEITLKKDKLIMEYLGKKAETLIPLLNIDKDYKLISGKGYLISKTEDGKIVIT
ncbi:MAG: hypothetical protein E7Z77_07225 [Methanobrevibacter sp.]|uniref:hypothetical protein n=1 Tax=Methanobrevibacter sp. TaxID=66852 RepID=UPI0025CFE2E3|nr:hypothetical protein [Methanobrevibacter sp.]MBE6509187.1 hypothetical protein [Methanobrevibacter sp.]